MKTRRESEGEGRRVRNRGAEKSDRERGVQEMMDKRNRQERETVRGWVHCRKMGGKTENRVGGFK